MNIADLTNVGREVISLLDLYCNAPHREMLIDPALFGFLRGRFSNVSRQHYVSMYGSTRPQRIDFRYGGSNPVVIEFAVRPPTGGGTLYGSQNVSELRKLCRVSTTEARLRVLLLVDLFHTPHSYDSLKASYDPIHAGRGKFQRNSVRVIYVQESKDFDFLWRPFRQP